MSERRGIDRFKAPIMEAIEQAFYVLPREEYLALLEEIRNDAIVPEIATIEAEHRAESLEMTARWDEQERSES